MGRRNILCIGQKLCGYYPNMDLQLQGGVLFPVHGGHTFHKTQYSIATELGVEQTSDCGSSSAKEECGDAPHDNGNHQNNMNSNKRNDTENNKANISEYPF